METYRRAAHSAWEQLERLGVPWVIVGAVAGAIVFSSTDALWISDPDHADVAPEELDRAVADANGPGI